MGLKTIADFTPGEDLISFSPALSAAQASAIVNGVAQSGDAYRYTHGDNTLITNIAPDDFHGDVPLAVGFRG